MTKLNFLLSGLCETVLDKTYNVTKPFNIASYALLTMMLAQVCGLQVGDFIHTLGDAHLYVNHLEQANLQLTRQPYPLPKMTINANVDDIFSFEINDFELSEYQSHAHIKAPVAI